MLRLSAYLLLVSTIFISGCGLYTKVDNVDITPTPAPDVVVNSTLKDKFSAALSEASRKDCTNLYMFFAGLSAYLENANVNDLSVNDITNRLLLDVQMRYNWNREKYPGLTDAISNDLISKKLDEPRNLTDDYGNGLTFRDAVLKTSKEYASIIKTIAESKKQ